MGDKREYGTGTLCVGKDGCWWARWRTRDDRPPHRNLGPARTPRRRERLTKKEAEAKLRELMLADNDEERSRNRASPTVKEMGDALIARMLRDDIKKSHIETALGHLRRHINRLLAAMTGMRLGELRAPRWSDIDYRAMKIRVQRDYVRGQYDKPKLLGSERGIPLAARLVTELDEHHNGTVWNQDSDHALRARVRTGRRRLRSADHFLQ